MGIFYILNVLGLRDLIMEITIPDGSPLLNFGTDGKAIGDPRWTEKIR